VAHRLRHRVDRDRQPARIFELRPFENAEHLRIPMPPELGGALCDLEPR
jgi:hypothetical protein